MKTNALILRAAALGLTGLLLGCAAPQPLYQWNGYPAQVYSYLKNADASPEQQIQALEKGIAQNVGTHAALPPGYQAHLGLLYLKAGRTNDVLHAWEREKAAFPESTQFIDYLIGNLKKNGT
ncbi:DUF4810 domain-containing protein [Acidovorax sp. CCYZU-2555]|uniref:DUF4810 domain-containing protein n=1 Tax=Acidovorax sp. CCYZU-2555 TaxID=2835042 RepID=UPI001BD16035|nr:DUF4810 domain-containing protein [Acidovorax sp. CCYZU-2555]MBS7776629.1 DUF4810 domain-containing protein [Acidovorax sp. CCYZU-2555]